MLGIVQWFNRRDDPGYANRPPGFPALLPLAHSAVVNESEPESSARTTARSILYMVLVVAPIVALEPGYLIPLCVGVVANLGLMGIAAAAIGSPIIGAYFILAVVRGLNHRDDPRHANQPPDHPGVTPVPPSRVEGAIGSQDVSPPHATVIGVHSDTHRKEIERKVL